MHACCIGERDLMTAVRDAGVEDVGKVRSATLERGGQIQVITK